MATAIEVRAPAEQTEGTRSQILRWLKAVGEEVQQDEPLIEIETDKVTVEVASPGSGTLLEILRQEQEEIGPGDLLGRIGAHSSVTQPAASRAADSALTTAVAAPASPVAAASGDASGRAPAPALSPAVRRLLAERGLDAAAVQGSGPSGRVMVDDVLGHVAVPGNPSHRAAGQSEAQPRESGGPAGPGRSVPHTPTRRRIAEHMVRSLLQTAPHVTSVFEADLSAVLAHRAAHKDDFAHRGASLTLTAYFLRAAVAAIQVVPEANSRWHDMELEIFDSIHIGIATALQSGLVVPVLKDAGPRDLFNMAQELDQLVARAREGRLAPADVRGGTFTISNHGVSGSLLATPIVINQPQAAILGIGKLQKRAVVEADADGTERIVIQPRCYVTLTIDHRVMDGHQANRFLQRFVSSLASATV